MGPRMLAAGGKGWGYPASARSWVDATQAVCQAEGEVPHLNFTHWLNNRLSWLLI